MTEPARPAPLSPDEATQRDQFRKFLDLVTVAGVGFGSVLVAAGAVYGDPRLIAAGSIVGAVAIWIQVSPRRALGRRSFEPTVVRVEVALIAVIIGVAILLPYIAFAGAMALLMPVAAALPYLDMRGLRRLVSLAWAAMIATAAATFIPADTRLSPIVADSVLLVGLTVAAGVVLFLLYESSESLKASGREFKRLFQLSVDLAETTEPAALGLLVAKHLAEATGFDECIIYALETETGRLGPFGSHPVERSLETNPESLADRPALGRAIHDRAQIMVNADDEQADPIESRRLQALGRRVMLLLPLVAQGAPVGVAELTASEQRPVDERRLALARTLAFEAAMAIENGRLYRELRHRALHDPLTGLANRSLFHDRVEHALARLGRRREAVVAVLFIDLDRFKAVNDSLGHARGDRLLTLVAERLLAVVRPADTVARLGGDEFALLLEDVASGDEALAAGERVVGAFAEPFLLAGKPVKASVSVGVAFRSAAGATVDELVQEADVAMYEAKRTGRARVVRFHAGLHVRSSSHRAQSGG